MSQDYSLQVRTYFKDGTVQDFPLTALAEVGQGTGVILDTATGYANVPSSSATAIFLGWATGDATGGAANGDVDVNVAIGPQLKGNVTITGNGSGGSLAVTDLGKTVFITGADAYTLIPPTNGVTCGTLVGFDSALKGQIKFDGYTNPNAVGGGSTSFIDFYFNLPNVADGDVVTNFTPGFACALISTQFVTTTVATTAASTTTLALEIGSTAVSGGSMTLTPTTCSAVGKVTAGAAIVGSNIVSAAGTISVIASATTAFGAGAGMYKISAKAL